MSVILCLHRGSSLTSNIIRWRTRGQYSHASLLLPDGRHTEALQWHGVVLHDVFTPSPGDKIDFFTLADPLSDTELAEGLAFMGAELGHPYDWFAIWDFLIHGCPRRATKDHWHCGEYATAWLGAAGRELFRDTKPWEVHPSLLRRSPLLVECEGPKGHDPSPG